MIKKDLTKLVECGIIRHDEKSRYTQTRSPESRFLWTPWHQGNETCCFQGSSEVGQGHMIYFLIGIFFSILTAAGVDGTADLSLIILLETVGICFLILGIYRMKDSGYLV